MHAFTPSHPGPQSHPRARTRTARPGARPAAGLTLIELMVAIAVLALLATLALPSFGSLLERHRLTAAAETLALDLSEARFQSAQSGRPLHLVFRPGHDWCWAVARTPACNCRDAAPACALKTVRAAELPGVELVRAQDASFDPGVDAGAPAQRREAVLRSRGAADELSVQLSPLGRARVCSTTGVRGVAAC
jgi:type IV fimbrial biogenesis protein FimT